MPLIRDTRVFPPYSYKEFPKWIKDKDNKDVLVHNIEEENALTETIVVEEETDEDSENRNGRSRRRKG